MTSPITVHVILFVVMSILYKYIPGGFNANFTRADGLKKDPSWMDVLYMSAVTHTTTGFGDFLPASKTARFLVTMHVILVFCFVILAIKI
jgi:uncharacterized membrane protein